MEECPIEGYHSGYMSFFFFHVTELLLFFFFSQVCQHVLLSELIFGG